MCRKIVAWDSIFEFPYPYPKIGIWYTSDKCGMPCLRLLIDNYHILFRFQIYEAILINNKGTLIKSVD